MVSSHMPRKTKIFVGHLPENCRNDELKQLFVRFGEVTECDVMNRYGFVHMAREEDAAAAIKALHNVNFKGATINVEPSTGKSRGGGGGGGGVRRDEKRGGPMRGGRGNRPGPYNDRRGPPHYSNRSGGGGGGGGYQDRQNYPQSVPPAYGPGANAPPPNTPQTYGSNPMAGYGPPNANDYPPRQDYNNFQASGGMQGDFNRGPAGTDYPRGDNYLAGRGNDPYLMRNEYDRNNPGPMRNGGYGPNYPDGANCNYQFRPMASGANYNTGAGPAYPAAAAGSQNDIFSRRPTNPLPNAGYPPNLAGYPENYDRPDVYGPPRGGGNRFPGPADPMPPRY